MRHSFRVHMIHTHIIAYNPHLTPTGLMCVYALFSAYKLHDKHNVCCRGMCVVLVFPTLLGANVPLNTATLANFDLVLVGHVLVPIAYKSYRMSFLLLLLKKSFV